MDVRLAAYPDCSRLHPTATLHGLLWPVRRGGRKWDVDGNDYVDFLMGIGMLLLGHVPPAELSRPPRHCPAV